MVELVLGDPRRKALELERDRFALLVARLEPDAHRALDRDDDALHRETALVVLAVLPTIWLMRASDPHRGSHR